MKKWLNGVLIGALSIGFAIAGPQEAANQLKGNIQQVLNILAKDNGKNTRQIRTQAENYAIPYFDFQRMSALAVGREWRSASKDQQAALTKEFETLLIRTYSGTMMKYKNAKVNVKDNPKSNNNGREIVVSTEVALANNNKPILMDYTMYQSGNKYRVYNVSVEGASLVTVYRNQFNETISKQGIDGLIQELKDKNNKGNN
ncbi:MlaC/ttg2D family ABC transporter substrate-binding protein [Neisseria sp. Ec49-e6-T10]|uniref:MlaC/ttg2D family ABC transporter substrate-binding protein n=1 Tax=Neisseria sp. Ec49-e6-T10 TaxID=3140744 RepID=UPI003EB8CD93